VQTYTHKDSPMLKVRAHVPGPTPEPLSAEAVNAFFVRLRVQMSLPAKQTQVAQQPDVEPRHWAEYAKRAGAVAVDF